MKIIERRPREKGFVLLYHCQNLLDDSRIMEKLYAQRKPVRKLCNLLKSVYTLNGNAVYNYVHTQTLCLTLGPHHLRPKKLPTSSLFYRMLMSNQPPMKKFSPMVKFQIVKMIMQTNLIIQQFLMKSSIEVFPPVVLL